MIKPLIYYHIPRTGGTSIARALQGFQGHVWLEADQIGRSYDGNLQPYLDDPGACIVQGHFPWQGHHPAAVCLRCPVDRTISEYWWARNHQGPDHAGHLLAARYDLIEFAERFQRVHNPQVKILAGLGWDHPGPVRREDFNRAAANLEQCQIVGVFARLDAFWATLASWITLGETPQLPWTNKTTAVPVSDIDRAHLRALNEWDYLLHQAAQERAE